MAGSSLLTLLDDIASLLDDVAAMTKVAAQKSTAVADDVSLMTKVAAKKTAGVLGDDLALNAQQVTGVQTNRELPVVWAVAKGSLVNKAILIPAALAISAFLPAAIPWLMMAGGAFLCYEGVEKLAHKFLHKGDDAAHAARPASSEEAPLDLAAFEKDRIKGAIRTDLILSAEIIVLSLGVMADQPLATQSMTLIAIGLLMTAGVYGLVAGIVKLDDLGLWLNDQWPDSLPGTLGRGLVNATPWLMKGLSVAGTAAMFLVGGGILVHNLAFLHHLIEPFAQGRLGGLLSMVYNAICGIIAGAVVLAAVKGVAWLRKPDARDAA